MFDTLFAYQRSAALKSAIDLDVFTAIDAGDEGTRDGEDRDELVLVAACRRDAFSLQDTGRLVEKSSTKRYGKDAGA